MRWLFDLEDIERDAVNLELTGAETADQLIKQLVGLRHLARTVIRALNANRDRRGVVERLRDRAPDGATLAGAISVLADLDESQLQLRTAEIEIGQYLFPLCDALDRKASRDQIFEAINTNLADRDTDMVRKYGSKSHHLICVLDLENSASTRNDEWTEPLAQPLKWCHQMAFMRELQTSPKLDRIIHEGANEFFNGAFGEYRERPLIDRLAGRAV